MDILGGSYPVLSVVGNPVFDYLFSVLFWLSAVFAVVSLPIKLAFRS